jgi:hypothetical protein
MRKTDLQRFCEKVRGDVFAPICLAGKVVVGQCKQPEQWLPLFKKSCTESRPDLFDYPLYFMRFRRCACFYLELLI